MNEQKKREDRIYSKLALEKLPFKLKKENFKILTIKMGFFVCKKV